MKKTGTMYPMRSPEPKRVYNLSFLTPEKSIMINVVTINYERTRNMRKILSITVLALSIFSFMAGYGPDGAWGASITGQALSTDIRAYVNGQVLSCLIINGRTAIVAEDLRGCGFDVIWQPAERKLEITEQANCAAAKLSNGDTAGGTRYAETDRKVLATDIKTYLNNKEINSFNIDGYTAIYLNELAPCGEVIWDPAQREACFVSNRKSGDATLNELHDDTQDANLIAEEIDRQQEVIEFRGEKLFYQEQQVGYARNGKAMISLDWIAGWLGYQVEFSLGAYQVKRGSHSFRVRAVDRQAQVFYDGTPAREVELYELPALASSRLYLYSLDLESLFGLDSRWDEANRQWMIGYADYRIKELGNYQAGSSFAAKVKYNGLSPWFNIPPELHVEKASPNTGGFIGDYGGFGDEHGFTSIVALNVCSDNEVRIWLGKKDRVLFYKQMTVRGEAENHQLEKQKTIGPFTEYSLIKPEQGFTMIDKSSFEVEGQVASVSEPVVHIRVAKIDKVSGTVTELPEQTLPLREEKFSGAVALNAGPGLYRVRFQVKTSGLHGIEALSQFGEFYLDYRENSES